MDCTSLHQKIALENQTLYAIVSIFETCDLGVRLQKQEIGHHCLPLLTVSTIPIYLIQIQRDQMTGTCSRHEKNLRLATVFNFDIRYVGVIYFSFEPRFRWI